MGVMPSRTLKFRVMGQRLSIFARPLAHCGSLHPLPTSPIEGEGFLHSGPLILQVIHDAKGVV